MKKTILILVITLFVSVLGYAQVGTLFVKNNISYSITSTSPREVRTYNYNVAGGTVVNIPSTIIYNGENYTVTSVGEYSFQDKSLTSVTIPNTVKSIAEQAFYTNSLTSVTIPNSVLSIGANAFRQNSLTSVNLGQSVTNLDDNAFSNNNITSISFPNSLVTIGDYAFSQNSLTNITIGNSVTTLGQYAFSSNSLVSVTIPNNVTSMGHAAFYNNVITNLSLSNNLTNIPSSCFHTNKITNVTIPNSITNIGASAFYTNSLTSVTIPNSVLSIGANAFRQNSLTSVNLGQSVTNLDDNAFSNNNITSISFPNSLVTIGDYAFSQNSLTNITIGNGVTTLGKYAFSSNSLVSVTIPNNVTSMGQATFYNNVITNLSLSNNLTNIPSSCFHTNKITSVTIPNSITNIGAAAFYNNSLSNVIIPNSVTSIANDAYRKNNISNLTLGNNVTSIGNVAFYNNSLTQVTIPSSVTSIGANAFQSNNLNLVTSEATTPPTIQLSTFDLRSNIDLEIPLGTKAAYVTNPGAEWVDFRSVGEPATVLTTSPSTVQTTSVTLSGNVTLDGGVSVTERGIVYSKTADSANPIIGGTGVTKDTNGSGIGVFSESIVGLTEGTQYSFKAYAINSTGVSYGPVKTFTTKLITNITFSDITKVYGDLDFSLAATSNSSGTITYSIVGVANGTSLSGTNNETVTQGDTGTVTIRATQVASGNYEPATKDMVLTINKAELTATATDETRDYGEANPAFSITYSGFQNGDTVTDLATAPTASTSATPASDVGTYAISVSNETDANYTITTVAGTLTVGKAELTATAEDETRNYGEANPAFSITYSGFQNGDTVTDLATVPTASTSATPASDVGIYAISVSNETDANYTITTVAGTLTVGKAELTATAIDETRDYGEANPAFSITYSGFQNGDTVTDLATVPTASTLATPASDVGTYAISVSNETDANYTITTVAGTLTVGKAELTATAEDKSRVYGEVNPVFTITYSGFQNGDTVTDLATVPTASTLATAASDVGSYAISVSNEADANYTITTVAGTLTVGKAELTATAEDETRNYGETNPTFSITYSGFQNGDTVTDLATAPTASTSATPASDVGTYTISVSNETDANYTITAVAGTLTVGKAELTATAIDETRDYGEANPAFSITYSGFQNGDTVTDLATAPTASTLATPASDVGTYTISVSNETDANYTITTVAGTLTVGKAELTATAEDKSRVYGEVNPAFSITYSGFQNGDTVTDLATAPTASTLATAASNVGSYAISVSNETDANYTITTVAGTLTVGKAELTATATDETRNYGEANPTFSITYSGFQNGDTVTDLATAPTASTLATAASDVGTYTISVSNETDANYTITAVAGTLTVGKAELTATAIDETRDYGEANPAFSITYSGFQNGDTVTDLATAPTASTLATPASDVGTYTISVSNETDANYTITTVAGTLTVGKAELTATATDETRGYGEANPAFSITYSGFQNGDTLTDLATAPTISTLATAASDVGTYAISVSNETDVNYTITAVAGTLTVGKAELTATATDETRNYGEANPTFSITYSGFQNGDTVTDLATAPTASTLATAASDVGTYTISVSNETDANYTITAVAGTLTVGKAELTATATDETRGYGEANPAFSITYSGFQNGDTVTDLATAPTASTLATVASDVGSYAISVSNETDANYTITTVAGTLTVGKAELTATAEDETRNYGETNPTFSITFSGFQNGDTVTDLATAPTASTSATPASDVGTYTISVSNETDANYTITTVAGTLTVGKAELTATAEDKSRVYGEVNPVFTITYSGFQNGDTVTDLATAPTASTLATAASNVGSYAISVSNETDANYTITTVAGTLTVGKAELTATAEDKSRVYGEVNPTFSITYSGFQNGDTVTDLATAPTASTLATAASDVGTYTISVSNETDANYTITAVAGTLTVGKAELTATATDETRDYGEANPAFSITYSGFQNGDTVTDLATAPTASTLATAASDVGTYTISVSNETDANYTITTVAGTLTVGKAELTATATDETRDYGEANPAFSITYSGFQNGDTVTDLATAPTASTLATAASDVGTYTISVSNETDANYTITAVAGTLTVGKAELTATAIDETRDYGEANPAFSITYSGFQNGDTVTDLATAPTASTLATAASDVGTYTISVSNETDANYTITAVAGTLTVGKAELTATAIDETRDYGEANPAFSITYSGFQNGDTVTDLATAPTASTLATPASDVGTYTISVSNETDANYTITTVAGTLTVGKAELTATAIDETRDYGEANPAFSITYSGFQNGDTVTDLATVPTASTLATPASDVGTYAISVSNETDANYTITTVAGTLTVGKAELTATAEDKSRVYGEVNPVFTITYSGFQNGDLETDLATAPTASTLATAASDVGTYAISVSNETDANYTITAVAGTLTVGKAELTATVEDKSRVYGEVNPVFTITYSGFQNGDTVTDLATAPTASTLATAASDVGSYAISVSNEADANYTITTVAGTLTVGKAELTATAEDETRNYGETNPTFSITYSGFQNGDTVTDLATAPTASTSATPASDVGTYTISVSNETDANYTITTVAGTLTVGKAELTATAEDKSRVYGEVNPVFTITYSGFQNGDLETDLATAPTISTLATAASDVGTYAISVSNETDVNYTITAVAGTLTVGKAELTATATDETRNYGEANPTFSITYSGFQNGDTVTDLATVPTASTSATPASDVGTYTISVSNETDANYTITAVVGTLTVGKAELTATATDETRDYGEANPAFSITYSGFQNGDTVTDLATALTASTLATAASDVGTYPISVSNETDANYTITTVAGTLTVGKAELIATATDETRGYGEANPAFSITYSGFQNGDTVTDLATAPTASTLATVASDVGSYAISVSNETDANYTITTVAGTLTVGKAELTATATDETRGYGEANPTFSITYSGFQNGDTVTDLATAPTASTLATAASDVGSYAISLSNETDANYTITTVAGTLTVGKAELTATATDETRGYGETNPTFSITYSGFQNGDLETDLATAPTISTLATPASDVGTYAISVSNETDANYTITTVAGTLTIGKAELTATAEDKSRVYGEVNPVFTITYSGFQNGDLETDLATAPTISTLATAASDVGTYAISVSNETDVNYTITAVAGTLTVGKAELTATATDETRGYGEANPTFSITYSGFQNGDLETDLATAPTASTLATAASDVGSYAISVSNETDANYTITTVAGTLTVGKAELTATAEDKSRVYGEVNPVFTITYSGFQNGDLITDLDTPLTANTTATTTSIAGTYNITISGDDDPNYTISRVNGILTIESALVEVVEDINGNPNGKNVTAEQLNSISDVSGAITDTNYTDALDNGTFVDENNPTAAEIQTIIDAVNAENAALAEVVEDIAGNTNGINVTGDQLNAIDGVSGALTGTNYTDALGNGTFVDENNPTAAEIQTVIDAVNTENAALAEVVEDIAGNSNGINVTADQLNAITNVSGALTGTNYTDALGNGTFVDENNPTAAEIQTIIDAVNAENAALAEVVEDIAGNANSINVTADQLNAITNVSGALTGTNYTDALDNGTFVDENNPTATEIQTIIDAVNAENAALAEVVEDINGNDNETNVTAQELNSINGVSGAIDGVDYTEALQNGTYVDSNNPTTEEIQTAIDNRNASLSTESFNDNSITVNVYPNPTHNIINVRSSVVITKVSIYDLIGQKVMEQQVNNSNASVNIGTLESAVYLVKVTSIDKEQTVRVVKE